MKYIEPHAHMVSRVTDDYVRMAMAGCQAICEPAFWAGFDRSSVDGFYDYFCQLTEHEPKRAAKADRKRSYASMPVAVEDRVGVRPMNPVVFTPPDRS